MNWESGYAKLRAFWLRHGHVRMTLRHPEYKILDTWMKAQRASASSLGMEQVRKLLEIGVEWSGRETSWYRAYFELADFKEKYGHWPRRFAEEADGSEVMLSRWVQNQRTRKKEGKLSAQQTVWLNALGMEWGPREFAFARHLLEMGEYRARHGHCLIPMDYPENPSLGHYVMRLRSQRHKRSPEEIAALDKIGFVWDVNEEQWTERFKRVEAYVTRFGHFPDRSGDPKLAGWVRTQRRNRSGLSHERVRKLEALGISWDPLEDLWRRRYEELQAFRKQCGHCRVPSDLPEWEVLWKWLYYQKTQRHCLIAERARLLEAIGIDWSIIKAPSAEIKLQQLEAYYAIHGHCNVSVGEDRSLGQWLGSLRRSSLRLQSPLRRRLDAMGMDWHPQESVFQRHLQELASFCHEHGHSRVPKNTLGNLALANWVYTQKRRWRMLSEDRRRQLLAAGLEWSSVDEAQWENKYLALEAHAATHGHCRVSVRQFKGLYQWCRRQKDNRARLTTRQVERLCALGFFAEDKSQGGA